MYPILLEQIFEFLDLNTLEKINIKISFSKERLKCYYKIVRKCENRIRFLYNNLVYYNYHMSSYKKRCLLCNKFYDGINRFTHTCYVPIVFFKKWIINIQLFGILNHFIAKNTAKITNIKTCILVTNFIKNNKQKIFQFLNNQEYLPTYLKSREIVYNFRLDNYIIIIENEKRKNCLICYE